MELLTRSMLAMATSRKIPTLLRTRQAPIILTRGLHQLRTTSRRDDYFHKLPLSEIQPKRIMPLKGYLYLPGNQDPGMPAYAHGPREDLPYAFQCLNGHQNSLEHWGRLTREVLDEYLPKFGAVMLRGLPINSHEDFGRLMVSTGYDIMDYTFGSDRRQRMNQATYAASMEASPVLIEMHTEGAYRPENLPLIRKIVFFCHKPCTELFGGETPICRVSEVVKHLKAAFLTKMKEKQLSYYRIMAHPEQDPVTNWKTRMNAKDEKEAEDRMLELGCQWRWNANGSVTYWHTRSAFIKHPVTDEDILFNQVTTCHKSYCDYVSSYTPSDCWEDYAAGTHVTYGTGEEIEEENLQDYRNAQWNTGVTVPLGKGDILFLDNLAVQHGRLNYHGDRKVYISMTGN